MGLMSECRKMDLAVPVPEHVAHHRTNEGRHFIAKIDDFWCAFQEQTNFFLRIVPLEESRQNAIGSKMLLATVLRLEDFTKAYWRRQSVSYCQLA